MIFFGGAKGEEHAKALHGESATELHRISKTCCAFSMNNLQQLGQEILA